MLLFPFSQSHQADKTQRVVIEIGNLYMKIPNFVIFLLPCYFKFAKQFPHA